MTDPAEAAFLAAIRANRADRVARLVYADWLDDHCPGCDRRAATAQFIRLSCGGEQPLNRQWPRAAYHWLLDMRAGSATNAGRPGHFRRLLPSFFALTAPPTAPRPLAVVYHTWTYQSRDWVPSDVRVGKLVETYLRLDTVPFGRTDSTARFHLTFDAGFLVTCDVSAGSLLSPAQIDAVNAALALDAPPLCRSLGVFR